MAHSPRRDHTSASPLPVTEEQIAEAMAKAVELRRRSVRDAVRATETWRLSTRRHRVGRHADDDPWYLVGWVGVEVP